MTLPNGTQTTYTYDPASQLTNILHQLTASATQINKADHVYNGVGNWTSLTDRRGAQAIGYDALDRLTSASHPLLGAPQAFAGLSSVPCCTPLCRSHFGVHGGRHTLLWLLLCHRLATLLDASSVRVPW
jgi:YD repeat-containing protein